MKRGLLYIICFWILLLLSGCSIKKTSTEKVKDLSFQVLNEESIPEEPEGENIREDSGAF